MLQNALLQVGVEKTKVNLENEAAQVEAEKCGVIAKDVTELQARCEKDLAAAEPLVAQAEAALDTLNKKDLGACLEQKANWQYCMHVKASLLSQQRHSSTERASFCIASTSEDLQHLT